MASRGRGRRGRPRGAGQAPPTFDQPPVFDQQAFVEAVGVAAAAIARASVADSQGGPSNLQRFRAHHPPTFTGGGDPMVADHWFMQIENVLEAMEITSDTTRIRLAAFQLEGEARVWWRWVRTSRDLEVMTWAEFQELFMGKYFPETARHAKAQEFLELKQGAMTMMDYVARFTELARFADYVATDLAKVRRFENGLRLSIRARIVGLRLQDMDSMVGTALTIERERWRMRETLGMRVLVVRGRTVSLLPVQGRGKEPLVHEGPRVTTIQPGTDESCRSGRTDESCQSGGTDGVLPLSAAWTHETGLPSEIGILGFWDITVPVSSKT